MKEFNQSLTISRIFSLCALTVCLCGVAKAQGEYPVIVEELLIDSIWAANGVNFDLETVDDQQFVAYFDRNRMMTVASREIGENHWRKKALNNQLMWDSHNSVVLGVDPQGYIHVSGNMHVDPLAYFRSTKPYDVSTMEPMQMMIGNRENRVTYPKFFNDKNGELYYSYRDGSSGSGNIIVNHFLPQKQEWERYTDEYLFEGMEENQTRSAYHLSRKDSKGDFHFIWLWRWTPKVETCHFLSYAKTSDLKHWTNGGGEAVSMPFTPQNEKVLVDPTPSKGGMHNSRHKIIITEDGTPIIGYVKFDEQGLTQLYLAKPNGSDWVIRKISDWDFRWEFLEGGAFMSIGGNFSFAGVSDNLLAIDFETETGQSGQYIIDIETLEHSTEKVNLRAKYPEGLVKSSDNSELITHIINDPAGVLPDGTKYILMYETMRGGFGRHKPGVIPAGPLSPLKLIQIR